MLYVLLAAISTPTIPIITPTPTIAASPLVTAVLTPIPTIIPTPVPTAIATAFPVNITNGFDFVDIATIVISALSLLATIFLGIMAFKSSKAANELSKAANLQSIAANELSNSANSLAQTAIEQSERTAQHEKSMRELENTIAVSDMLLDVYNFFINEVSDDDFIKGNSIAAARRLTCIGNIALLLFDDNTYNRIKKGIDKLIDYVLYRKLQSLDELSAEYNAVNVQKADLNTLLSTYAPNDEIRRYEMMKIVSMLQAKEVFIEYRLFIKSRI